MQVPNIEATRISESSTDIAIICSLHLHPEITEKKEKAKPGNRAAAETKEEGNFGHAISSGTLPLRKAHESVEPWDEALANDLQWG